MTIRLSVIVITKNEAHNIRECLESVHWVDEIIVVDANSSDGTVQICAEYANQVVVTEDWPGFGLQKNRALDLVTGDWVLSLDADERVSEELGAEIRSILSKEPAFKVFELPRLSSFCGKPIHHGDWWPDYVTRLFRRGTTRFTEVPVHESLDYTGPRGRLQGLLHHLSIISLEQMQGKITHYTSAGAKAMRARGRKGGLWPAITHSLWAFFRGYVLRRGFLDGREGFMIAVSGAESTYYRYLKLMYLDREKLADAR